MRQIKYGVKSIKEVKVANIRRLALELNTTAIHLLRGMQRIDDESGVPRARLSALSVLVFGGATTLVDLARMQGVTPATMHHVVKALEEESLIKRGADKKDRRKKILAPTAKGHKLMINAREARLSHLTNRLAKLSAEDLDAIERTTEILRKWEENQQFK